MGLAIGEWGLAPAAFWALTLPEFAAALRRHLPSLALPPERDALERLIRRFPDGGSA